MKLNIFEPKEVDKLLVRFVDGDLNSSDFTTELNKYCVSLGIDAATPDLLNKQWHTIKSLIAKQKELEVEIRRAQFEEGRCRRLLGEFLAEQKRMLAEAPIVYASKDAAAGTHMWEESDAPGIEDTHCARLVHVKEIKK